MKKSVFFVVLFGLLASFGVHAEVDPLSDTEVAALRSAVQSMDEGETGVAIALLEALLDAHPDNYSVAYELGFAHYLAGDYDKSIDVIKSLIDHPDADQLVFGQLGNCYDELGCPEDALKAYQKGVEYYPNSGSLWTNIGITQLRLKEYNKALESFETSIEVDPFYDPAYYRAAQLYADSNCPIWALIYAEAHMLLSKRDNRNREMAQLIVDVLKENIKVKSDTIQITLHDQDLRSADTKKGLPFEMAYEMGYALGSTMVKNGWTLESVTKLRGKALDVSAGVIPPTDRMVLSKIHKAVKDAGYWDAYNLYIFAYIFPEEAQEWISDPANEKQWDGFFDFYNSSAACRIDSQHTFSSRLLHQ